MPKTKVKKMPSETYGTPIRNQTRCTFCDGRLIKIATIEKFFTMERVKMQCEDCTMEFVILIRS